MSTTLAAIVSIGFHGLAFAMVLYLISVGLSVTMGMMGFVNLAHGVFAMLGGYVMTSLMSRMGVPLLPALICAFVATALGNTPGHLNHWSTRSFVDLLARHGEVGEVRTPFPWTMLLVRL